MIKINTDNESDVNFASSMTPMIDVILVLVVFMMLLINAPIFSMDLDLPNIDEKSENSSITATSVSIGIKANSDNWFLNDKELNDLQELEVALIQQKQTDKALEIMIQSDKKVPMEKMVALFAILQKLKINVNHLALK